MLYSLRGNGQPAYALHVNAFKDGTSFYILERRHYPAEPVTVLCFTITSKGWLIGDGRDMQTARRAQRLTKNWA